MSNTSTFAVGLGGGLGLWYLTKSKSTPAASPAPSSPTSAAPTPANPPAPRNCVVRIDATGLLVDGARVDVTEAIRRCEAAGHAAVTVARNAPASTYAALMTALGTANLPAVRNAGGRTSETDAKEAFTLITYPNGSKGKSTHRYFRAESPIAWAEARDRLAAAGLLELALAGRTREPGGWMLSIASRDFRAHKAEPLPGRPRNSVASDIFTLAVYPEGVGGPKRLRWFQSSAPILWEEARDRLAAAGFLDLDVKSPMDPGYWILVISPNAFQESRAEPMPARRKPRGASRAAKRYTREGRTIVRDGEPIVYVDRVDLGNERYAVSPHQADQLTERVVRLLNRHGAR